MLLVSRPASTLSPVTAGRVRKLVSRLGGRIAVLVIARGVSRTVHVSSHSVFVCVNRLVRCSGARGVFGSPTSRHAETCLAKGVKWLSKVANGGENGLGSTNPLSYCLCRGFKLLNG